MICFMLLPCQKPPSSYSLIKFVYQSVTPVLSGARDNMEQHTAHIITIKP